MDATVPSPAPAMATAGHGSELIVSQPDRQTRPAGEHMHDRADRAGRWNQMPAGAHERACDDDDEAAPKLTGFKQRKSELGRTALFYFNLFSCYSNIKHGKLVTL